MGKKNVWYQIWKRRLAVLMTAAMTATSLPMPSMAVEVSEIVNENSTYQTGSDAKKDETEITNKEPEVTVTTPSDADQVVCICTDICDEENINKKCPVCSEDYDACEGNNDRELENDLLIGTPSDATPLEIVWMERIDDMTIVVTADPEVFPEDAVLRVKKIVVDEDEEKIATAIHEVLEDPGYGEMEQDKTEAFDITILDGEGDELQPDTSKGEVRVSFECSEAVESNAENTDMQIFHLTDDLKKAEQLENTENSTTGVVEVVTEHFSVYAVRRMLTARSVTSGVTYETTENFTHNIYANGNPLLIVSAGAQYGKIYIDTNRNGEVDTGETEVTDIKGDGYLSGSGIFYSSDRGGYFLPNSTIYGGSKGGEQEYDTYVAMTGTTETNQTVWRIFGGNAAGTLTGDTCVNITGGMVQYIYGGSDTGEIDGSTNIEISGGVNYVYGGNQTSGVITGNTNLTFEDGASAAGWIYGGGAGYSDSVITEVKGAANISINGGNLQHNVYGGGWTRNAKVAAVNIVLDGGTVAGNIYGGGECNTEVTGQSTITINTGTANWVVGSGAGFDNATSSVDKSLITVNGGSITGGIEAAGSGGGDHGMVNSEAILVLNNQSVTAYENTRNNNVSTQLVLKNFGTLSSFYNINELPSGGTGTSFDEIVLENSYVERTTDMDQDFGGVMTIKSGVLWLNNTSKAVNLYSLNGQGGTVWLTKPDAEYSTISAGLTGTVKVRLTDSTGTPKNNLLNGVGLLNSFTGYSTGRVVLDSVHAPMLVRIDTSSVKDRTLTSVMYEGNDTEGPRYVSGSVQTKNEWEITATANFADQISGVKEIRYLAVENGGAAPTAEQVRASEVSAANNSQVTLGNLKPGIYHLVYAVAEDGAGNISDVTYIAHAQTAYADLRNAEIKLEQDLYTYNATPRTPKVESVTLKNGTWTVDPADYRVTYANNDGVSNQAQVIITPVYGSPYSYLVTKYFTIRPAKITVTAKPQTITYGESIVGLDHGTAGQEMQTITVEGLMPGHYIKDVILAQSGDKVSDQNKTVTPFRVNIGRSEDDLIITGYYEMEYKSAALTINPKTIAAPYAQVTGSYTYQGTPIHPEYSIVSDPALSAADYQVNVTDNTDAGTGKITVVPAILGNYTWTGVTKEFEISKKPVAVKAADRTKVYGDSNPEFILDPIAEGILVGNDTAETLNISLSTTAGQNSPAGDYDIIGSPAADTNYDVTVQKGELTIQKKSITISAYAEPQRIYVGDPEPNYSFLAEELVNGDSVTGVSYDSRVDTSRAGDYEVIPTGTALSIQNADGEERNGSYMVTYEPAVVSVYEKAVDSNTITDVILAASEITPPPSGASDDVIAVFDKLQETAPSITGLDVAAGDLITTEADGKVAVQLADSVITGTQAAALLEEAKINTAGETIKLVVEPYLDIQVQDVKLDLDEPVIVLDIKAYYNVKATTAADSQQMQNENTITIATKVPQTVTSKVTISLPLPDDFPTKNLYVKHTHEGQVNYYSVSVTDGIATFVNEHGFSTFELMQDERSGSISFTENQVTVHYTPENIGDELPQAEKAGYRFRGWKINGKIYTVLTEELLDLIDTAAGHMIDATASFTYINTGVTHDSDDDSGNSSSHASGWLLEGSAWRYYDVNGTCVRNAWKQVAYNGVTAWYHFDANGDMQTGWFLDVDGSWYYLNPTADGTQGMMKTGWFTDPYDGYRYYLDPTTGKMAVGHVLVDGVWYEFNTNVPEASGWYYHPEKKEWMYDPKAQTPLGAVLDGVKK